LIKKQKCGTQKCAKMRQGQKCGTDLFNPSFIRNQGKREKREKGTDLYNPYGKGVQFIPVSLKAAQYVLGLYYIALIFSFASEIT
jgi:hypothetical protein